MVAHELATLNEAREENIALKESCEALRARNAALQDRNGALENTVQGTAIALDSLIKAIKVALPADVFDKVMARAHDIAGAPVVLKAPAPDIKPNKKNRPSQVALVS